MKIKNFKSYAKIFLLSATIALTGHTNNHTNGNNAIARCSTMNTVDKNSKHANKEKKYNINDLYLVNTKLIDSSIKKGYYIVKETSLKMGSKKCKVITKNKKDYTNCFYNSNKKDKSLCFFQKYKSIGQEDTATFVSERHYQETFPIDRKNNTYFCIKANIDSKHRYKKLYTLEPGTIDGNPTNLKKANRFEASISSLEDVLKKPYVQEYYTESEIKNINNKIAKNKQKVLK